MQEVLAAISAGRRALDTVEGFARDYLGIQAIVSDQDPAAEPIPAVEPTASPTIQPDPAPVAADPPSDPWEVVELSDLTSVKYSGTRAECEAWADANLSGGFGIRPVSA